MEQKENSSIKSAITLIILAGSLWGLSEVAINEIVTTNSLPLRASILTGIAFMIMGALGGFLKKARYLIMAAVPAIIIVQMGVILCGNSIACKTNTCVALASHAGMLASVFAITGMGRKKTSYGKTFIFGSAAALSSAVAFYFIGMRCAPCPYLLSFNSAAGFASYLYAEALPWMIFSGTGFSIGYLAGTKKSESTAWRSAGIKFPQFAAGLSISFICWIASAGIILNIR